MPDGFEELKSLQHLECFQVGNAPDGRESSKLDALLGLKLKGSLWIKYNNNQPTDGWIEDEFMTDFSMLSASLKLLIIIGYPGMKILASTPNLVSLTLIQCFSFSSTPPLSSFAYLKRLVLGSIYQLEYFKDMGAAEGAGGVLFFPCLKELTLYNLPKFKGAPTTADEDKERERPDHHHSMLLFPRLSYLYIGYCPELRAMPLSPCLQCLELVGPVGIESMPTVLSTSLKEVSLSFCEDIVSLQWDSLPNLRKLSLREMPQLESFMGEAVTSLSSLSFFDCNKLKKVKLAPADVNALEELRISRCPDLEMWEENKTGIDWESLPNLRLCTSDEVPDEEKLPRCLQDRCALGNLVIADTSFLGIFSL